MTAPSDELRDRPVLDVHVTDGVWTFTLQRPGKLNALDEELVEALLAAVQEAHESRARLLVFRGAGKSFSAGFDLSAIESESEGDLVLRFVRIEMLLQAIARSPALTMGLAHGMVFGAGADLFAACRLRVAAPDTVFRMPGLKFGLVLGTRRFGDLVGREVARDILENVRSFTAAQAEQMAFANRLAAQDDWPAVVEDARSTLDTLDDPTRAMLYEVLTSVHADQDLATLARSAARPGLKSRLRKYLNK